ncbi:hypothetical protein JW826_02655 [Candidatus Woesearchaeota archaeon]|nr:hypothetical protein [Candidatus Woesearchaeota archaeon]
MKQKKGLFGDVKALLILLVLLSILAFVVYNQIAKPLRDTEKLQTCKGTLVGDGNCVASESECEGGVTIPGWCEDPYPVCCIQNDVAVNTYEGEIDYAGEEGCTPDKKVKVDEVRITLPADTGDENIKIYCSTDKEIP